jgi:hypothetical protein
MSGVTMPTPPAPPSPSPRRIAAPSWLDLRLVLGVLLVLASVLIGAKVVSGARQTYPRVTVRHELAAGAVVGAGDLRLAQVQLPDHGKRLSRPVSAGELLPASALDTVKAQTTVTVPLASGSAPQLHKGQRIELWVSTAKCSSLVLLPDVTVQAVHGDSGGSFGSGSDGQDVVISVPPDLAERVVTALAIEEVRLRAGVLAGPTGIAGAPLPDLGACVSAGR